MKHYSVYTSTPCKNIVLSITFNLKHFSFKGLHVHSGCSPLFMLNFRKHCLSCWLIKRKTKKWINSFALIKIISFYGFKKRFLKKGRLLWVLTVTLYIRFWSFIHPMRIIPHSISKKRVSTRNQCNRNMTCLLNHRCNVNVCNSVEKGFTILYVCFKYTLFV